MEYHKLDKHYELNYDILLKQTTRVEPVIQEIAAGLIKDLQLTTKSDFVLEIYEEGPLYIWRAQLFYIWSEENAWVVRDGPGRIDQVWAPGEQTKFSLLGTKLVEHCSYHATNSTACREGGITLGVYLNPTSLVRDNGAALARNILSNAFVRYSEQVGKLYPNWARRSHGPLDITSWTRSSSIKRF